MLTAKTGTCKICKSRGRTEWHHIISQYHSIRTGQEHLLHTPDNVIELCKRCHSQTTASMVRKRLTKKFGPVNRTRVRPLTSEQKKAAREKKRAKRKKVISASLDRMEKRGVVTRKKSVSPKSTIKRFHRKFGRHNQICMKKLYPSDHWLHNPSEYDDSLSRRFEREWVWTGGGGAIHKSRINIGCLTRDNNRQTTLRRR